MLVEVLMAVLVSVEFGPSVIIVNELTAATIEMSSATMLFMWTKCNNSCSSSMSGLSTNLMGKFLRALSLPEAPDAGESVRIVSARAGGVHHAPLCAGVKVNKL